MSLPARRWALGWILGVILTRTAFPAPAALAADAVYWSDYGKHEISFARLDGSGGGDLATGTATVGNPIGVAIDSAADTIYWSNGTGQLSFANLDGSGGGDLQTGAATVASPYGVAIDSSAGRLFWANFAGNKLSFVNLAGSGGGDLPTLTATVNGPTGVAVDPSGRRLYWANYGAAKLSFVNLDGSAAGDLPTGAATMNAPNSVAVDPIAGRIYWSNYSVNKLSWANLDGSGGGDLATGAATVHGPVGIALDPSAGRIYWANHIAGTISYANLDGSGGGDLPTTGTAGGSPFFVSLLKAPTGAGAPVITGGSEPGSVLSCSNGSWAADLQPSFLYRAPASFAHGWTRNGEAIAGAMTSTYTASAGGDYRCRATASNRAGSGAQTSAPHTITGPPAPPAVARRIDSAVQTRWGVAKTGKRFVLLRLNVTAPPGGSTVQLRCSGKRCPFRSRTFTQMRNGDIRVFRNLRLEQAQRKRVRRFRAGQLVEVRITALGYIGRVVRYRLKQGRDPVGRGLCLAPGADKPSRCAA